jgi:hypothetical protein
MCRSIKVLRRPAEPVTKEEISAAALQFVRKVSGFRQPSKANQAAFETAVREIAEATGRLLTEVSSRAIDSVKAIDSGGHDETVPSARMPVDSRN